MPRPRLCAMISIAFLAHSLFLSSLQAATIVVAPDGTGDAPDLQAAIAVASDGDEIVLTDGIFTAIATSRSWGRR